MLLQYLLAIVIAMAVVPTARSQPILYVTSFQSTLVWQIPSPFTTVSYGTGMTRATGIARDSGGNLYVANEGPTNSLMRIPAGGGPAEPFATGFLTPRGVTLGPDGFLYVANVLNDTISRVSLAGGTASPFASGFDVPSGLRFGPDGNLYVSNLGDNSIRRVGPAGGAATMFASGFNNPFDVAFDAAGNLYASNFSSSSVSRVGPDGGAAAVFATGIIAPTGLEFDPEGSGDLFVASNNDMRVFRVPPTGGAVDSSHIWAINVGGAGFMAVQVPEPASLLLASSAIAVVAALKQRRRPNRSSHLRYDWRRFLHRGRGTAS